MGFETDVFERWGEALAGGYQIVPNQLLRLQQRLDLSSHQIVILLNLSMHWWKKQDFPFVGLNTIAKRMGVSRRTVERQVKKLCNMGLVQRRRLPQGMTGSIGYTVVYDLTGLVTRLESMPPAEVKSSKLAERINELRASRVGAAGHDTVDSEECRRSTLTFRSR